MICLNTEKLDLFIIICRILLYIWLQCTHMTILIIIVRKILMLTGNYQIFKFFFSVLKNYPVRFHEQNKLVVYILICRLSLL